MAKYHPDEQITFSFIATAEIAFALKLVQVDIPLVTRLMQHGTLNKTKSGKFVMYTFKETPVLSSEHNGWSQFNDCLRMGHRAVDLLRAKLPSNFCIEQEASLLVTYRGKVATFMANPENFGIKYATPYTPAELKQPVQNRFID